MAHEMIGTQIVTERLVALLESGTEKVLLIDSRPFVEYNTSHILEAININCSKLMKRRLQQDKVLITELIQHSAKHKVDIDCSQKVVVYDQSSQDVASLSSDCFLTVLLGKLEKSFSSVHLLAGGFAEFSRCFPGLCEGKSALVPTCISQPCLPVANIGPTRILPNLYLGCQRDVLNKELMQQNGIGYVLNASNTCPKPDFIPESHFLRVPVNDSFCEKILPWLDKSVDFIGAAKGAPAELLLVHATSRRDPRWPPLFSKPSSCRCRGPTGEARVPPGPGCGRTEGRALGASGAVSPAARPATGAAGREPEMQRGWTSAASGQGARLPLSVHFQIACRRLL